MSKPSIKVLVVEDETDIRELILLHLCRQGYTVTSVESGEEALQLLQENQYDLVILDWMLPTLSGIELLQSIQQINTEQKPAIIMVTARTEPNDIVEGLNSGADDYLSKPFEPAVLIARCEAILRRLNHQPVSEDSQETLKIGDIQIKPEFYEVSRNGRLIELTRSEFRLLLALVKSDGRVLTRDQLIGMVQGEGIMVIDRTIDTHIFGLRKKLGEAANVIETIRGIGYRIRQPEKLSAE